MSTDRTTIGGVSYDTVGSSTAPLLLRSNGTVRVQQGLAFIDLIKNGKIGEQSSIKITRIKHESLASSPGLYLLDNTVLIKSDTDLVSIPIEDDSLNIYDKNTNRLQNYGIITNSLDNIELNEGIVYDRETKKVYKIINRSPYDLEVNVDSLNKTSNSNLKGAEFIQADRNSYIKVGSKKLLDFNQFKINVNGNMEFDNGARIFTQDGQSALSIDNLYWTNQPKTNYFAPAVYAKQNNIISWMGTHYVSEKQNLSDAWKAFFDSFTADPQTPYTLYKPLYGGDYKENQKVLIVQNLPMDFVCNAKYDSLGFLYRVKLKYPKEQQNDSKLENIQCLMLDTTEYQAMSSLDLELNTKIINTFITKLQEELNKESDKNIYEDVDFVPLNKNALKVFNKFTGVNLSNYSVDGVYDFTYEFITELTERSKDQLGNNLFEWEIKNYSSVLDDVEALKFTWSTYEKQDDTYVKTANKKSETITREQFKQLKGTTTNSLSLSVMDPVLRMFFNSFTMSVKETTIKNVATIEDGNYLIFDDFNNPISEAYLYSVDDGYLHLFENRFKLAGKINILDWNKQHNTSVTDLNFENSFGNSGIVEEKDPFGNVVSIKGSMYSTELNYAHLNHVDLEDVQILHRLFAGTAQELITYSPIASLADIKAQIPTSISMDNVDGLNDKITTLESSIKSINDKITIIEQNIKDLKKT